MDLSFYLLDKMPLPHLSPTFKIYIYKTGNPAWTRLTGSKWIPSRHASRGPCSALARATQSGKHNWHPIFQPFLSSMRFYIRHSHLLKNKSTSNRNSPFLHGPSSIITTLIALSADKSDFFFFWSPFALLSSCRQFHCQLLIGRSECLLIPSF